MKLFVEAENRHLFGWLVFWLAAALLAAEGMVWAVCPALCLPLLGLFLLLAAGVLGSCYAHLARREKTLEDAAAQVRALLDGDTSARLDAGAVQLEKTEEDLRGLLEETARPFACRAKQEEKTLTVTAGENMTLLCDRVWMSEAVGNLIKNALDHTCAGDTVAVEGDRFAAFVRIRVRDTGAGIHPEDLPHLFKRFYRSRFAQDTPGIGLGLPLAKSIVEAHGGTLEVESELGRGTVFTMLLRNPTKL